MKAFKWLPAVAAVSLALTGCGSDSKSGGVTPTPPPTTKYTWKIVNLYKDQASNVASSCAVFKKHIDEVTPANSYVVAARMATSGYKVTYHRANGSIIAEHTLSGTALSALNGSITINADNLPDDGYVAIEEWEGKNAGSRESYIFAVQKDLLQDMTITIREPQDGNACYTGDDVPDALKNTQTKISVSSNGGPKWVQTSASDGKISTGNESQLLGLPVYANSPASERKLVTSFATIYNSESDKLDDLVSYGVANSSDVYTGNTAPNIVALGGATEFANYNLTITDLTVSSTGVVSTVLDNKVYAWQPVFNKAPQLSLSYAPSDSSLSHWSISLETKLLAANGSWNFSIGKVVDGNAMDLQRPTDLSNFLSTDISTARCVADSNGYSVHCLDANSFNAGSWQVQRTHVRATTDNSKAMFQTIYAKPSQTQVLIQSETEKVSTGASDKVAVGLAKSNGVDKKALMKDLASRSLDVGVIVDDLAPDAHKYDLNGVLLLNSESNALVLEQMQLNRDYVTNSVNWL